MKTSTALLQGTLDLLVLRILKAGTEHGWGISQKIQAASRDVLTINQGSIYPALRRLEKSGMIRANWGTSSNNRRARYYELTSAGRSHLEIELATWQRFAGAVNLVLAS